MTLAEFWKARFAWSAQGIKKRTAQPSFTGCGPRSEKGSERRAPSRASMRALNSASPGACGSKLFGWTGEIGFSGIAVLRGAFVLCLHLARDNEAILGRAMKKSQWLTASVLQLSGVPRQGEA